MVDLAVGVVIGAAFGTVVSALVVDILTPFISAIAKVPDLSKFSFSINGSEFLIGHFINAVISFVLVAATIFFFVIKPMNILVTGTRNEKPLDPTTKKCPECLSEIPLAAIRCAHCTEKIS